MAIWDHVKGGLSNFVPNHVHDPVGLINRMLRSKRRAAGFTLLLTGLGVLFLPVDLVLHFFEKRRRKKISVGSSGPYIIVCGPARSGTTLVYQMLAERLNVSYVRNFTVMFARSPLVASTLFTARRKPNAQSSFENYYGKTAGMQAPSEANHLWNQWVTADTSGFRTIMDSTGARKMVVFLKLFSAQHKLPLITKNNNANAFADIIANNLDNCYFVCLRRKAEYLAQSLLLARLEINGDIAQSYGVVDVASDQSQTDPVKQVMGQIRFLDNLAVEQQALIGKDRFWIVDYEDFCENPEALANRISTEILGLPSDNSLAPKLDPIVNNNQVKDRVLFASIQNALKEATD